MSCYVCPVLISVSEGIERRGVATLQLIAIVDDDELFRRAIAQFVASLGYAVEAFGSAEEFLGAGHLDDVACLICDLHMPGIDGLELHERLLAQDCRLLVIFITAYAEPLARRRALAAGALGFFDKPFPEHELISCLDRVATARKP
jgi:FixJ family two-component response regulator